MKRRSVNSIWLSLWVFLAFVPLQSLHALQSSQQSPLDLRAPFNWPIADKPTSEVLLDHGYFQISYNQVHLLANWVFYRLSSKHLGKPNANREDNFMADPLLVEMDIPYLDQFAFKGSGYDRGHMAPSADFLWNQAANDSVFVMSNMAPQSPALNRYAWKYLEQRVRGWACAEKEVQVIVGPVLEEGLSRLPSGVSVPRKFFKIILDLTAPRKAVAFIYHQNDHQDVFKGRAMTVDEVESVIGFDVFSDLEITEQNRIESELDLGQWKEAACLIH